jgi:hypothetical protein
MATAFRCRHYDYARPTFPRNTKTLQSNEGAQCALGVDLSGNGATIKAGCCNPRGGACAKREPYTIEEIVAAEAEADEAMSRAMAIIPSIPSKGDAGDFACPCCDGTVRWSRARSNGHVWAACSTPNCFSLMQ